MAVAPCSGVRATEYGVLDTLQLFCPQVPSEEFVARNLLYDPVSDVVHASGQQVPEMATLDPLSMRLLECFEIGAYSIGLALDAPERRLYALCRNPDLILELDADSHAILDTLPSGPDPEDLVINVATKKIYVSNYWQHCVTVVDAVGDSVITTLFPGAHPGVPSVSKEHNRVYVPIWNGSLAVIDGEEDVIEQVIYLYGGICESELSWYNEADDRLYVSPFNCPVLTVLDGQTLERVADDMWLPGYPSEITGNPGSGFVYVTAETTLAVVNPGCFVEQELPLGGYYSNNICCHPATDRLFVEATWPHPPIDQAVLVLTRDLQGVAGRYRGDGLGTGLPSLACSPNPFHALSRISCRRAGNQPATLSVLTVAGRLVRHLADRRPVRGALDATWDGTDDRGLPVAGGVYFFRLDNPQTSVTCRALLLR